MGTSLDEYNYFENFVFQADTVDGFVGAIEQILQRNYKEEREKRTQFAMKNDWKSRLDRYMELMKVADAKYCESHANQGKPALDEKKAAAE